MTRALVAVAAALNEAVETVEERRLTDDTFRAAAASVEAAQRHRTQEERHRAHFSGVFASTVALQGRVVPAEHWFALNTGCAVVCACGRGLWLPAGRLMACDLRAQFTDADEDCPRVFLFWAGVLRVVGSPA